MARKNDEKLNYGAEIRSLKENGPQRLYLLWGVEDYLREQYLAQLKTACLPEGEDSFSFKRMDGPDIDVNELAQAVDAMPFLSDRSFVEIRGLDLNKLKDADRLVAILSDIPDYCTVALVQSAQFEPDGRLKAVKAIRALARELKFTQQSQGLLIDWIIRRFAAAGKGVELDAVQRLIFVSGDLMNKLIPEIEKIAAYAKGERITVADIDAVAEPVLDARIFDMTNAVTARDYDRAAAILSELLRMQTEPIVILAALGKELRKLYTARMALDTGKDRFWVKQLWNMGSDYPAKLLMQAAKKVDHDWCADAVKRCQMLDRRMKSERGIDSEAELTLFLMELAGAR